MSMFEDSRFRWRETYFVLFRSSHRPKLKAVEKALAALDEHYQLDNLRADEQGRFESLSLVSPDDFAALDICYTAGAEVLEQAATLAQEIRPEGDQRGAQEALRRLVQCDARFEILHFEQVPEFPEEDEEPDGMFDPSTLLLVLQALANITEGIAVDPQAGAILNEE
jgi:hypothetical protein